MAPPARTLFALSGLIVLLVAAACGNGSPDQSGERGNSTIDGLFTVAASPVSEDRLVVDGMVEIQGSLVALASSDSRSAGLVLRGPPESARKAFVVHDRDHRQCSYQLAVRSC